MHHWNSPLLAFSICKTIILEETDKIRGKRSKQYRKLMHQYELTFGFREPYQIIVDAKIVEDAARFKMDLPTALERTLHGKIKPST